MTTSLLCRTYRRKVQQAHHGHATQVHSSSSSQMLEPAPELVSGAPEVFSHHWRACSDDEEGLPALVESDDEEEGESDADELEWHSDEEDQDYDISFDTPEEALISLGPELCPFPLDHDDNIVNESDSYDESDSYETDESTDDVDEDVDAEEVLNLFQDRSAAERPLIDDGHGLKPACSVRYTQKHRKSRAGSVISASAKSDARYASDVTGKSDSEPSAWAPFTSKMDWEVAKWAKLRSIGSTDVSELLGIEGVCDSLNLSYKNAKELNDIIDSLPTRPEFHRNEVKVNGQTIVFHSRNVTECLEHLWRDPGLVDDLILEPERQYADEEKTSRIYHEMNTGDWWWTTQAQVEKATGDRQATIVPVIISLDKTQLTTFRNKQAYPVYMTLGNIPKHICRKPTRQAQVLLAYLPTDKLEHISNKSSRRRAVANLFHACMRFILEPLKALGEKGIELTSGDGAVRRCYPILAAYVGDYPEQVLVTLVKTGRCPVCPAPRKGIGDKGSGLDPRDIKPIRRALAKIDQGADVYKKACTKVGIKPVQDPFWRHLPYCNIYSSITPDLLHQLYQGVIKHLVSWLEEAIGTSEIDKRCSRFPPNHHIRLFLKGISGLSRVTGTEHDQMCRFLLGIVLDVKLSNRATSAKLIKAVRAMLDFLYLAKFPVHSTATLKRLSKALRRFQKYRQVFVDLEIREHFDITKLHFLEHYFFLIQYLGSLDNFNTEYTERLHIDMTKDAFRATNNKDEYSQMTKWLDRRERMLLHEKFIKRALARASSTPLIPNPRYLPSLILRRHLQMARNPTHKALLLTKIVHKYGAIDLIPALQTFAVQMQNPGLSGQQVKALAPSTKIPFRRLAVYHRIKYTSYDPHALDPSSPSVVDSVHVDPPSEDKYGNHVPGHCVAQVRCVFTLAEKARSRWFPNGCKFKYFAYVEWFLPFSRARIDSASGLYRITRAFEDSGPEKHRKASIIPIDYITQSIHLLPKFGPAVPLDWTSDSVLEDCETFYVNTFSDRFVYSTLSRRVRFSSIYHYHQRDTYSPVTAMATSSPKPQIANPHYFNINPDTQQSYSQAELRLLGNAGHLTLLRSGNEPYMQLHEQLVYAQAQVESLETAYNVLLGTITEKLTALPTQALLPANSNTVKPAATPSLPLAASSSTPAVSAPGGERGPSPVLSLISSRSSSPDLVIVQHTRPIPASSPPPRKRKRTISSPCWMKNPRTGIWQNQGTEHRASSSRTSSSSQSLIPSSRRVERLSNYSRSINWLSMRKN
ncbi:hypothetical protein NP233_g10357 [Leucocoprinus birnbaumii]|uniref:Uncharacterized protein n=1 Tax=Leucocoprinus birnbaumii TaxID=56174 RepID=A0AAD5YRY7_9AGAR|nr:hypothetical protein NP233_g10357 [Leucocoprinus birnbaumii]